MLSRVDLETYHEIKKQKRRKQEMKLKKRLLNQGIATFLALASLTACAGSASSSSSASTAASESVSTAQAETQYTGEAEPLTLPLTQESKTIKIYAKNSSNGVLSDYGQLKAFEEASKRLGVTIEWIMPAQGSESDQFNLMVASGEYPDIIFWDFSTTPMKLTGLMDSDIVIPMDNLIRQYAPNYLACLEKDEGMKKQALSDTGTYDAMYKLEPEPARLVTSGPTIRKDLLDKYDLQTPETIEDWHNVLSVIKENEPNVTAPVATMKGMDGSSHILMFMSAYHTNVSFLNDVETGKVVYGPMTDNYKDFLSTMAQWYKEGLIDPEYMTTDYKTAMGNIASGKSIAGFMMVGGMIGNITQNVRPANPDFELIGTPWPVLKKGEQQYTVNPEANIRVGGMAGAITKDCKDPVLAVKLMDYFYSEEGATLLNWGIDGESYTEVDGKKVFTDAVLNDPNGKTVAEAIQQWAQPLQGFTKPMDYEAWKQITLVLPEQIAANKTWADGSTDMILPNLELPSDKNSDFTKIMNDVTTYMNEMSMQFITGQVSVEDGWDSYVQTLKDMKVETACAYKQEAWDAFNNR